MRCNRIQVIKAHYFRAETVFPVLFAFFLPFENSLYNTTTGLYVAYLLYTYYKTRRFESSFNSTSLQEVKYLSLLFTILAVSLFYSEDKAEGLKIIFRSVPLALIPLFFCFNSFRTQERNTVLLSFVWGNVIAMIFNILRAFWRSLNFKGESLEFDASVLGGQEFWYSIAQGGNYFFIDQFSTFLHPTYWSVYLLFSMVIVVSLLTTREHIQKRRKTLYYSVSLFLILGIFLCSSRIVMIATGLTLIIYLSLVLKQSKSFILLPIGLMLIIGFALVIVNSPRIGGLQNLGSQFKYDMRLDSWRASLNILKSHPILGLGVGDSEQALLDQYLKMGLLRNYELRLDEHNQFLQIANQCGMIGLLIFLGIFKKLARSIKQGNFLAISFLVALLLVCLTECFISRQAGLVFFSFFYCLLFCPADRVETGSKI